MALHPTPAPQPQNASWRLVQERVDELINNGAIPVEAAFSPTVVGQGDLVYHGRRFLITPNDEAYRLYAATLERAGLPHVVNDPELGDADVVVGEISRDARVLEQVMLSVQSESGMNSRDAFRMFGQAIRRIIAADNVVPRVEDLSAKRAMILRAQAEVLLTPPLLLEPASDEAMRRLVDNLGNELVTQYGKFGAHALGIAFKEGLDNVDG